MLKRIKYGCGFGLTLILIRIRIQHFSLIRIPIRMQIRVQAKTVPVKFLKVKLTVIGYCQVLKNCTVSYLAIINYIFDSFSSYSKSKNRIRIHKDIESGSTTSYLWKLSRKQKLARSAPFSPLFSFREY
jgi:hypothetical protein